MPRLENWSLVDEPYSAPEENRIRLAGTVYGREGFQDGVYRQLLCYLTT